MATDFIRQVIKDNFACQEDLDVSSASVTDIFDCITRLQLESVIEQSLPSDDLAYREEIAYRVFSNDKRDAFKVRNKIPLSRQSRVIKRQLKLGHLALLSRSDLITFAQSQ